LSEAEKTVRATAGAKNLLNMIREYQRLGVKLITVIGIDLGVTKSFKDQIMSKVDRRPHGTENGH
jgi:hypothetical protein